MDARAQERKPAGIAESHGDPVEDFSEREARLVRVANRYSIDAGYWRERCVEAMREASGWRRLFHASLVLWLMLGAVVLWFSIR